MDIIGDRDFTRRQTLGLLGAAGAAGAGLVLGGGRLPFGVGEMEDAEAASCILTPEQEEGPFYVDIDKVRSNIRAGQKGVPLVLVIKIVNSSTCKPIKNAAVDVWHANGIGKYSDESSEGTSGKTWLRGTQLTNSKGIVRFTSIYPGFYEGRAPHIHAKVHVGGNVSHNGQMFLPESLSTKVYKLAPYTNDANSRTSQKTDHVYTEQHGASSTLAMTRLGKSLRKGVRGRVTLGVDPSAAK